MQKIINHEITQFMLVQCKEIVVGAAYQLKRADSESGLRIKCITKVLNDQQI